MAETQGRVLAGAGGGRVHRSAGRPHRPRRLVGWILRRGRLRLRREDWHGLRYETPPRPSEASRCARNCEAAIHESRRPSQVTRALGAAEDCRAGVLHRVDGQQQAAPSAPDRRALRQGGQRSGARIVRARKTAKAASAKADQEVVITHPEKILFPDDGITKGDLAKYYETVAAVMLPHVTGRPITMER